MKHLIFCLLIISISSSYSCQQAEETNETDSLEVQIVDTISICTFNIQFLGHFSKRNNEALTDLVRPYDIVVIQELVAPPIEGYFPDSSEYKSDIQSKAFHELMIGNDFSYKLSEEDTGTNDVIHLNSTATEWFIVYYKDTRVLLDSALTFGFLEADRSNNENFERVPYCFGFKSVSGGLDFALISVHLQPGNKQDEYARRAHELMTIEQWISNHNSVEKDFIILGDMNIEDSTELRQVTPDGYLSLNNECRQTNTLQGVGKAKPYDQIMYDTTYTGTDLDLVYDCNVIDLISEMRKYWNMSTPYPGDPYVHNTFKQYFSDHNPVLFKMIVKNFDDD